MTCFFLSNGLGSPSMPVFHQKVTEYIASFPSPQKEICQSLRELILENFPQMREEFKWNYPAYYLLDRLKAPGFSPDSYPHVTNGGEKQDERPQEAFAKRASLSRWFANPEDHHGSVPDSHPGVPLPSKTYPPSW